LPETVIASINAKIAQTQLSIQKENQVAQAKAEADIEVAKATGLANARTIEATAEANANKIISASLTPELVQYQGMRRWDGKLPQVSGGSTPFINISPANK